MSHAQRIPDAGDAARALEHADEVANRDRWSGGAEQHEHAKRRAILHAQAVALVAIASALENIDDSLNRQVTATYTAGGE